MEDTISYKETIEKIKNLIKEKPKGLEILELSGVFYYHLVNIEVLWGVIRFYNNDIIGKVLRNDNLKQYNDIVTKLSDYIDNNEEKKHFLAAFIDRQTFW